VYRMRRRIPSRRLKARGDEKTTGIGLRVHFRVFLAVAVDPRCSCGLSRGIQP
jgi:hypothetical protein